jgi:hypothetical protein
MHEHVGVGIGSAVGALESSYLSWLSGRRPKIMKRMMPSAAITNAGCARPFTTSGATTRLTAFKESA